MKYSVWCTTLVHISTMIILTTGKGIDFSGKHFGNKYQKPLRLPGKPGQGCMYHISFITLFIMAKNWGENIWMSKVKGNGQNN